MSTKASQTIVHTPPAGLDRERKTAHGVVFYCDSPTPKAIAYKGKGRRPAFYHHYIGANGAQRMFEHIEEFFSGLEAEAKMKQQRRAALRSFDARDHFKAGDIVTNTWGWEQTNVDFYEVISVTKTLLTMRQLVGEITERGSQSMSGTTVPVPGQYESAETVRHQAKPSTCKGQSPFICFPHGSGEKWDGQPKSCSWYG